MVQVQATTERALESWWEEGHPGWMIFSLGTKHFETLDEIIQVCATTHLEKKGPGTAANFHILSISEYRSI